MSASPIPRSTTIEKPLHKGVTIEFKFEQPSYKKGKQFTSIGQILVLLLLAAGIFMEVKNRKKA